jgi:NitT/TauT family transport system substrate-binding protein
MTKAAKELCTNRRTAIKALIGGLALTAVPIRSYAAVKNVVAASGIDAYFSAFPVAAAQGLMKPENVNFSVRSFEFGGIALDALLTHDAQVGSSSPVTAMTRWDHGGRLYTVGALSTSGTSYGATGSERVRKPEDLYGKAVAFPALSSGQYFYEAFLKKYNLDGSKIQTKSLPPAEALVALQRGDIDAFFMWEPWNSRATMTVKGAHTLVVSQDVGIDFVMYLYFSDQLVGDKTLSQDVMGGLIEASSWVVKNPDQTVDILYKTFRLPKADSTRQLQGLKFDMSMHRQPVVDDFNKFADFALRTKMIKNRPAWNEMMRPEIMKSVAPQLVSGW